MGNGSTNPSDLDMNFLPATMQGSTELQKHELQLPSIDVIFGGNDQEELKELNENKQMKIQKVRDGIESYLQKDLDMKMQDSVKNIDQLILNSKKQQHQQQHQQQQQLQQQKDPQKEAPFDLGSFGGLIIDNGDLSDNCEETEIDPSTYVNPEFLKGNQKSRVIYVRGLDHPDITIEKIYNLFSNYGNIQKIKFLKQKNIALIEYETQEHANQAKDLLNHCEFMGNTIRTFYSNYQAINTKMTGSTPLSSQGNK